MKTSTNKFTKWLLKPSTTLHERIFLILAAYTFTFILISIIALFYNWLYATNMITSRDLLSQSFFFVPSYKHQWVIDFFMACCLAPFAEEVIFRHFPLRLFKKINGYKEILLLAMMFSSLIFGYMHNGTMSLPLQ